MLALFVKIRNVLRNPRSKRKSNLPEAVNLDLRVGRLGLQVVEVDFQSSESHVGTEPLTSYEFLMVLLLHQSG